MLWFWFSTRSFSLEQRLDFFAFSRIFFLILYFIFLFCNIKFLSFFMASSLDVLGLVQQVRDLINKIQIFNTDRRAILEIEKQFFEDIFQQVVNMSSSINTVTTCTQLINSFQLLVSLGKFSCLLFNQLMTGFLLSLCSNIISILFFSFFIIIYS